MELRRKAEMLSSQFQDNQISPVDPLTGPLAALLMTSQAANENANPLCYSNGPVSASRLDRSAELACFSAAPRLHSCQNQLGNRALFHHYSSEVTGGGGVSESEPFQTGRKWPSHGSERSSHAAAECSEACPLGPWRCFVPEQRFSSADRHLTQRNAELGGAALLSNKERFQNIGTSTVLDASRLCTPRPRATRCNLQNGRRMKSTSCQNKLGISFQFG